MKKKILALSLVLCMLLPVLTACSNTDSTPSQSVQPSESTPVQPSESTTAQPSESAPVQSEEPSAEQPPEETLPAEDETVLFTDSLGREVEIPASITKIAVSGPMAQIAIFAIAPEMLVGLATDWDAEAEAYIPTELYNMEVLGQLYGGKGELNLEQILVAAPDIIIDIGEPKDGMAQDMDDLQAQIGIPTIHITMYIEDLGKTYRTLGELLGKTERGEEIATYCERIYSESVALSESLGSNKVNLLYCLGDKGINVIASGSYHAELIDLMSNNLAVVDDPSSRGTGNEVDMEQILLWNPEVIIFAQQSIYSTVADDPAWQEIDAIKSGRYYEVPFGPYNWMGFPPSVQRLLGLMWMSELLYSEQSGLDLYEEVKEYYNLFYGCDLTQEMYDALVANSIGK